MFQVYEEPDLRNVTLAGFWNGQEGSASLLEPEAATRNAGSPQHETAENVTGTSSRIDCAAWLRWFENQIEEAYNASGRSLEIIADVLEMDFEKPECIDYAPSLPAQVDVFGDGPFTAGDHRQQLMRYLEQLATRMGLRCPEAIASVAVLVIERAIEWARASGNPNAAQTARLLFQCLRNA